MVKGEQSKARQKRRPSVDTTEETPQLNSKKLNLKTLIKFNEPLKCKNPNQKELIKSIENNDVTVALGPAGSGKSFIAIATALNLIKEGGFYTSIFFLKSMAQLEGEEMPTLPGDAMLKMENQNMSFFDSLIKLLGEKTTNLLIELHIIKFGVLGSLRGRDLSNTLIVCDEVQNVTKSNLKTILTRLSEHSKIILLGDPDQIDIKQKHNSSLKYINEKILAMPMEGVGTVVFTEDDIVRHRLTSYFISLFKEPEVVKIHKEIVFRPLDIPTLIPKVKITFWEILKNIFTIK